MDGQFLDFCSAKMFVPRGHFAETGLFSGGVSEQHVARVISDLVKPGQAVIDIGANIGIHAFRMAELVGNAGRVYAVEADIDIASYLRKSILESGNSNICLLPVAASNDFGIIHMSMTGLINSAFSPRASKLTNPKSAMEFWVTGA